MSPSIPSLLRVCRDMEGATFRLQNRPLTKPGMFDNKVKESYPLCLSSINHNTRDRTSWVGQTQTRGKKSQTYCARLFTTSNFQYSMHFHCSGDIIALLMWIGWYPSLRQQQYQSWSTSLRCRYVPTDPEHRSYKWLVVKSQRTR